MLNCPVKQKMFSKKGIVEDGGVNLYERSTDGASVVKRAPSRELLTRLELERQRIRGSFCLPAEEEEVAVAEQEEVPEQEGQAAAEAEAEEAAAAEEEAVEPSEDLAWMHRLEHDMERFLMRPLDQQQQQQQQQQQHPPPPPEPEKRTVSEEPAEEEGEQVAEQTTLLEQDDLERSLSLPKSFLSTKYGLVGFKNALPR